MSERSAAFDFVADGADVFDALSCRVLDVPVLVAFAGEDRAGIPAAHRDHDVGGPDGFVGPRLGELSGDVDAALGHGGDRCRVDLNAWLGATGPRDGLVPGERLEEAECHLGAARVVRAQEQHDGFAVVVEPFNAGQCLEALVGEPFGQQRRNLVTLA